LLIRTQWVRLAISLCLWVRIVPRRPTISLLEAGDVWFNEQQGSAGFGVLCLVNGTQRSPWRILKLPSCSRVDWEIVESKGAIQSGQIFISPLHEVSVIFSSSMALVANCGCRDLYLLLLPPHLLPHYHPLLIMFLQFLNPTSYCIHHISHDFIQLSHLHMPFSPEHPSR
jgi:hypothetical protein